MLSTLLLIHAIQYIIVTERSHSIPPIAKYASTSRASDSERRVFVTPIVLRAGDEATALSLLDASLQRIRHTGHCEWSLTEIRSARTTVYNPLDKVTYNVASPQRRQESTLFADKNGRWLHIIYPFDTWDITVHEWKAANAVSRTKWKGDRSRTFKQAIGQQFVEIDAVKESSESDPYLSVARKILTLEPRTIESLRNSASLQLNPNDNHDILSFDLESPFRCQVLMFIDRKRFVIEQITFVRSNEITGVEVARVLNPLFFPWSQLDLPQQSQQVNDDTVVDASTKTPAASVTLTAGSCNPAHRKRLRHAPFARLRHRFACR